jgi:transcriptional regulator GlxA family with amidase domain
LDAKRRQPFPDLTTTGLISAVRWLRLHHRDIPIGAAVRQPSERCRHIVHEVEEIARTFAGKPLSLFDIYREASVGPGMIRFAFREVHGCPPRRFLHDQRLRAVRAKLRRATPGLTVTQVATSHGFVELGRFAVQYREAFGESPSVTLRCALMRYETKGAASKRGA